MSDDDIQSVMVYVDEYARARQLLENARWSEGPAVWKHVREEADQCRRNLIARFREIK